MEAVHLRAFNCGGGAAPNHQVVTAFPAYGLTDQPPYRSSIRDLLSYVKRIVSDLHLEGEVFDPCEDYRGRTPQLTYRGAACPVASSHI
jgi:hypothetical protein